MRHVPQVLCFLVILSLPLVAPQNVAMSPCIFGRATSGWYAPQIPPDNYLFGTCSFAPAQPFLPSWYANHYLAAPEEETYNGYPWTSSPISVADGGIGKSCDTSNCQGSLGGYVGGPDLPDWDVDENVFSQLSAYSGSIPIAYRKVSCDMQSTTVGIVFTVTGSYFFRAVPYGMIVGITSVEVSGSGTGGQWTPLVRSSSNYFEWIDRGDVGLPFNIRVNSILGDTITFPQAVNTPFPMNISSGQQFPVPPVGYGGAQSAPCPWPGADPDMFVDGFGGPPLLKWTDWGSYVSGGVLYNVTTGCVTPPCIQINPSGPFQAMQLGHPSGAPLSYWANLTFWIRSDVATTMSFFWTGSNIIDVNVTTTWTYHSLSNADLWANDQTNGQLKVLQVSTQSGGTTRNVYLDDIRLINSSFKRLYPIIGGLQGPPPVGLPGYTGLDPYTGQPTPVFSLPTGPVEGYIQIIGDVSLLPNATLSISVNPGGSGGYVNVTGCVDVLGALNITVNSQPTPGTNISFLESPCISNNGTSFVVIKGTENDRCDGVKGTVDFTDETHLGVLFAEGQCDEESSGLSKGAIAGIAIGTVAGASLVTAGGLWALNAKKAQRKGSARRRRSEVL